MWKKIADAVNAVGVAMRTTTEVRERWRNLHLQGKKEYSELAKEQKKTGGGPAPKMPLTLTRKHLRLPASRVSSPLVRVNVLLSF